MPISLKVNGKTRTVDVPADMPLLWVLRDELDLKGTKYGCGVARCGACTVHVNGVAQRTCNMPVSRAAGAEITTIEGLSPDGAHAVQQAWEELDVPQCGYCQAGQMMAAAALIEKTPRPSDADIDTALNTNLCRCATYLRIRAAVHRAAAIKSGTASTVPAGAGRTGPDNQRED
ncbi:(2Fe-2S)-binding protein [Gemmatimonas aurantiaca]|uniref:(2Fe-2S)-binding protein n=1 Tax=Gemmatimonas aurantiaca TaxID=173480 RepID=UPI00301CDF85